LFSDRKSLQRVASSYSLKIEVLIQLVFPAVAVLLRRHGRRALRRGHGNDRFGMELA
jgi:peptidoglycan/LPS O-acetylase OafA/YrhL